MDEVSLVETIRHRVFLRCQGLQLPRSKCTASLDDLIRLNWEIISGKGGWKAVSDFHAMLEAPEDSNCFLPWLGSSKLRYGDAVELVVPALCSAWKRLVFPYQALPWKIFDIIWLDDPDSVYAKLSELRADSVCNRCPVVKP